VNSTRFHRCLPPHLADDMIPDSVNRRHWIGSALLGACTARASEPAAAALEVPVQVVLNKLAKWTSAERDSFRNNVWNEAVQVLRKCGISLRATEREGEIHKYPSGRPRIVGMQYGVLNIVLTDTIPMAWDNGRGVAGVATVYEGYHLALISIRAAHGNRVPFLHVNTVLHELIHMFFEDFYVPREGRLSGQAHEHVIDWHATRMWLFSDGDHVKHSAAQYIKCLNRGCR
jgi:hypothetical protein